MGQDRSKEITLAARKLYGMYSFKDINLKLISTKTSISRPSIYNYFETKEEIFLEILKEEFEDWKSDLEAVFANVSLTLEEFSDLISSSLEKHEVMLKIESMNLYEIEDNSRLEKLIEFKKTFNETRKIFISSLTKFFPSITEAKANEFTYHFLPFLNGVYPFVYPTGKQEEAMDAIGMERKKTTVKEITESFMIMHLKSFIEN